MVARKEFQIFKYCQTKSAQFPSASLKSERISAWEASKGKLRRVETTDYSESQPRKLQQADDHARHRQRQERQPLAREPLTLLVRRLSPQNLVLYLPSPLIAWRSARRAVGHKYGCVSGCSGNTTLVFRKVDKQKQIPPASCRTSTLGVGKTERGDSGMLLPCGSGNSWEAVSVCPAHAQRGNGFWGRGKIVLKWLYP